MSEVLVETVLLSELGEHLALDPGFAAIKGTVAAQLLDDEELAADLQALAQELSNRTP